MHSMIIVLYHQIKTLILLQHKKELKWMLNHVMKFFRERIEGDLSSPSMLMSCSPPHCCSRDCSLHVDTLPSLSPPMPLHCPLAHPSPHLSSNPLDFFSTVTHQRERFKNVILASFPPAFKSQINISRFFFFWLLWVHEILWIEVGCNFVSL